MNTEFSRSWCMNKKVWALFGKHSVLTKGSKGDFQWVIGFFSKTQGVWWLGEHFLSFLFIVGISTLIVIVYTALASDMVRVIEAGIELIQNNTCIRFKYMDPSDQYFILFDTGDAWYGFIEIYGVCTCITDSFMLCIIYNEHNITSCACYVYAKVDQC